MARSLLSKTEETKHTHCSLLQKGHMEHSMLSMTEGIMDHPLLPTTEQTHHTPTAIYS